MSIKNTYILYFLILATACSFNYGTISQIEEEPNLIMEEAEYIRITEGSPEIRVAAREVRHYEKNHIMELDDFSFEQFIMDFNANPREQPAEPELNSWGRAGQLRLETDTNNFSMSDNVIINVDSENLSIETDDISWNDNDRLLQTQGTVHITRSDGTFIEGTGFSADTRSRSWEFESAVEGTIIEETAEEETTEDD